MLHNIIFIYTYYIHTYYNTLKYQNMFKHYIISCTVPVYIRFEGASSYILSLQLLRWSNSLASSLGRSALWKEKQWFNVSPLQHVVALGYLTSSQTSTKSTRHGMHGDQMTRAPFDPTLLRASPSLKVETVGDAYIAGQVRPHESSNVFKCLHGLSVSFRIFPVCKFRPRPKHLWPSKTPHCVWCVLVWKWPFGCRSKA